MDGIDDDDKNEQKAPAIKQNAQPIVCHITPSFELMTIISGVGMDVNDNYTYPSNDVYR
jgi:hypothetical protein